MLAKTFFPGLLLLALAACDDVGVLRKISQNEEVDFARQYVALFQSSDIDALEARFDPELADPYLRTKLQAVAAAVPPDPPKEVTLVGWKVSDSSIHGKQYEILIQYEHPTTWLVARVVLARKNDHLVVQAVQMQPRKESLQKANEFSLMGKPLLSYAFLLYAIWVPCLIIFALVTCIRTPISQRKWLWMIFILGGVGLINLNWVTGGFGYTLFFFQVLGSGFVSGTYAPTIISSSLPLGALMFLSRHRRGLLAKESA